MCVCVCVRVCVCACVCVCVCVCVVASKHIISLSTGGGRIAPVKETRPGCLSFLLSSEA